jgi:hypothetical protein
MGFHQPTLFQKEWEAFGAPRPRSRRLMWGLLVALGLILVVSAFSFNSIRWIGAKRRMLVFATVNSESGAPVGGASIVVVHGLSEPGVGMPPAEPDETDHRTQRIVTDDGGRAELLYRFVATGFENAFVDRGSVRFYDTCIRVTADGYDPSQFRLGERIGEVGDIHDESRIVPNVKLKPTRAMGDRRAE